MNKAIIVRMLQAEAARRIKNGLGAVLKGLKKK